MKNLAVFASGRGSNFLAIQAAVKKGRLRAKIALVVCDNQQAGVIAKAKKSGVKAVLVIREDFKDREAFENKIIEQLRANKIDLIVLAGFMRMFSDKFVRKYSGRMINVHPSLLPSFKGAQAIKDAFQYGVKVTGVT